LNLRHTGLFADMDEGEDTGRTVEPGGHSSGGLNRRLRFRSFGYGDQETDPSRADTNPSTPLGRNSVI
jgi:hypothetical protein